MLSRRWLSWNQGLLGRLLFWPGLPGRLLSWPGLQLLHLLLEGSNLGLLLLLVAKPEGLGSGLGLPVWEQRSCQSIQVDHEDFLLVTTY